MLGLVFQPNWFRRGNLTVVLDRECKSQFNQGYFYGTIAQHNCENTTQTLTHLWSGAHLIWELCWLGNMIPLISVFGLCAARSSCIPNFDVYEFIYYRLDCNKVHAISQFGHWREHIDLCVDWACAGFCIPFGKPTRSLHSWCNGNSSFTWKRKTVLTTLLPSSLPKRK